MTVLANPGAVSPRPLRRSQHTLLAGASARHGVVGDPIVGAEPLDPSSLWAELLDMSGPDDDLDLEAVPPIASAVVGAKALSPRRPLPHRPLPHRPLPYRPLPQPSVAPASRRSVLVPTMPRRWPLAVVLGVTTFCSTVSLVQQANHLSASAGAHPVVHSRVDTSSAARAAWLAP